MDNKTRICPKCKSKIIYKTIGYRNYAEKHNKSCKKCQQKCYTPPPNTKCKICKKPIYRVPSRLKDGNHVCSYACRNKYFSKELSFVWKGGKAAYTTRARKRDKIRKLERKIKAVEMGGGKCQLCGYTKCIAAMDFHHLDPGSKDSNVKNLWGGKWKNIEKEIRKCQLLCANCHRELHWKECHE